MGIDLTRIDPFIRFAETILYKDSGHTVWVSDNRLLYTVDGTASLAAGGTAYALHEGTMAYCPAGSEYQIASPGGFRVLAVNFDLTQEHRNVTNVISPHPAREEGMPVFRTELTQGTRLDHVCVWDDARHIYAPLCEICRTFQSGAPLSDAIACSLLKTLLLRLHQDLHPIHPAVKKSVAYIRSHYMTEIRNGDLAALMGYHEYYLNSLFRRDMGQSIHRFLLETRLNAVREQLVNTELPLSEIAERSGFTGCARLSDVFKAHFGMSPSLYRRRFQNNV